MADDWKPKRRFVDPTRLTRKVFDKHVDRMTELRARDKQDHRADMKSIFHRVINLEQALQDLADHVASHCQQMGLEETPLPRKDGKGEPS